MLPVVKGDDETRRQIFLYSLLLFGTTLVLATRSADLGRDLPHDRGRCWVGCSSTGRWCCGAVPIADRGWRLFTYSILYLAALFGAVALDALVPLRRR